MTYAPRATESHARAVLVLLLLAFAPPSALARAPVEDAPRITAWTGDFDEMVEHHVIRALVVYSKTFFFLDGADQKGISHDLLKAFEESVNEQLGKEVRRVQVVFVPVRRDQLIPGLIEGRGDLAVANLTVTPERLEQVDFSVPFMKEVDEVVVASPGEPALSSVDDLSGKTVHVRASSSYHRSLVALNERFAAAGKPGVELVLADENLEDEDLLEMVNADLIPLVVVDRHKADFWDQIFDHITVHRDVTVREGGQIAWAMRKDSPRLAEVVNRFIEQNRKGTLLGNILLKRYLKNTGHITNALAGQELEKFEQTIDYFKRYAGDYGFDWLIVAALGYQESRLDQSVRSHVGAIGVMQVMPATAADPNVGIPNIEELESNIHAGVKYLHFLRTRYFDDDAVDQLNQWLFSFAAYNAGPARVRRLRKEAAERGLDPDVWFRNVEIIAAERIGRETVQYVGNIFKYYIAYKLIIERYEKRAAARRQ